MTGAGGKEVDHINGDGLDNRRANLRKCSHGQNMMNRVLDRRNKVGARGVSTRRGKFRACIKYLEKTYHLGTYLTKEEAAAAYTGAAKVLYGDFAPV